MSANNVVWVMNHITFEGLWHVFYSGCMDNTPDKPDFKDKYYKVFGTKSGALMYAHEVVDRINEFSLQKGHVAGVEYGVCIVPNSSGPWKTSGLATIMEYVDGIFRIRRYGWEAILPRNHIDCMKNSIGGIYAFSLKEGREVEWVKMKSMVDHLEIEDSIAHILPMLDALYIVSRTVTNKDIQKFVGLVENMVNKLGEKLTAVEHNHNIILERLEEGLKDANKRIDWRMEEIRELSTTGEKPREPLVMPDALKAIMKDDVRRYIKNTYIDGHNDGIKRGRILESKENGIRKNRKDGCYQFTYCSECLAYPMGLGCPNLTKGPVQLKKPDDFNLPENYYGCKKFNTEEEPCDCDDCKEEMRKALDDKPRKSCDECGSYGQCDHQGAYKTKDGKWCYE